MLGCDIVEIERVRDAAQKEAFITGVFTQAERAYYAEHGGKAQTLAGMFCAKEAVAKALGCGFRGFRPNDIEILHTAQGAPYAVLRGRAAVLFPRVRLEISVSHCNAYAMAVCTGHDE
ncbi:MAG: holo-ACP synthase [Clostridia bacterium]|jgi:holo-[acyl-carrier protein] synthase|nr:holo-ACP synthase [Clostridia bacterium]